MTKRPLTARKAFTLLELIVVAVIMAIVAATAVPAFMHTGSNRVYRAADELASHLRFARDLAMSARRRTWVNFNTGTDSYILYIEDTDNPGRANRIDVTHPVTGASTFQVVLGQDDFDDVEVSSATFPGGSTRSEVEFDRFGQPYNGMGSALIGDGAVVLASDGASRTVYVTAQTGMIYEE